MKRPNYSEEPYLSIHKACEADDVDLLTRVITPEMLAMKPMQDRTHSMLDFACDNSIRRHATSVLSFVVSDCKFSLEYVRNNEIASTGNTKILDILLAHGWDINDYDLSYYLVSYCLSHGADVYPRGQPPISPNFITTKLRVCPPLLEEAAAHSTVATFDLLQSYRAPIGWRTLHLAVQQAARPWLIGRPDSTQEIMGNETQDRANTYAERMAMVRHLVEDVGLDVNAIDQPVTQANVPTFWRSTPLCYVYKEELSEAFHCRHHVIADTRDLTWYLLDQGADPTQALDMLQYSDNTTFAADVEAWQAQKRPAGSRVK